jgi:hypothetical protein
MSATTAQDIPQRCAVQGYARSVRRERWVGE